MMDFTDAVMKCRTCQNRSQNFIGGLSNCISKEGLCKYFPYELSPECFGDRVDNYVQIPKP